MKGKNARFGGAFCTLPYTYVKLQLERFLYFDKEGPLYIILVKAR